MTTSGAITRSLNSIGTFRLDGVTYMVSAHYRYETVLILADEDDVIVASAQSEVLAEHIRPRGRGDLRWQRQAEGPVARPPKFVANLLILGP